MIAASEPQEFVPFGRQQIKRHPGAVFIPNVQRRGQSDSYLAHRFSQVNLDDTPQQEWWMLRNGYQNRNLSEDEENNKQDVAVEEELYVSGRTVVISRGNVGRSVALGRSSKTGGRILKVCYTMECPIRQALWCQFPDASANELPRLCIIDTEKISVYKDGGSEYTTPLQFKVAAAWNTKYGLLIERVAHRHVDKSSIESCGCEGLTTMFSLIHPLDEISPVLSVKQGGVLSYMNDPCLKIVFTSDEPSLCLLHNAKSGFHSIWKIRKAVGEECQWMCGQDFGIIHTTSTTNLSSSNLSGGSTHLSTSMRTATLNRSLLGSGGGSPLFGRSSTSQILAHSLSPQSPLFHTSHSSMSSSPRYFGSVIKDSPISSASSIEARLGVSLAPPSIEPKPIVPELCMEYIWSESYSSPAPRKDKDVGSIAKKAFLTKDTLGQEYLCYLIQSSLVLVRLRKTNNTKTPELIVGTVSYIQAKDAVPIPALELIAVLDLGGCVILYTGTTPIGKLHIAGVSAELASVSYLTNISSVTTINTPFPKGVDLRRSSLLSSTRMGDAAFDERVHLLSPVISSYLESQPSTNNMIEIQHSSAARDAIQCLRDPVGARFTIEYLNGSMFRFTLPEFISSPLVCECVKVLKCILQKDVALLTMAKWYTVRNAPGTQDISPKQEWHLFISCLLGLLGYQLDSLPLVNYYLHSDCDTPAKNTKKMRASDLGSNEDWNYLINSAYHDTMSKDLGLAFSLDQLPNTHSSESSSVPENTTEINTSSLLYPYMHLIVFSLHLLYEELKLKPVLSESLPLLVRLLHQLCSDLRLKEYCSYYWRDFPCECTAIKTEGSQLPESEVVKLPRPSFMPERPSSLYEHIYRLIVKEKNLIPYPCITGVNNMSRNILEILGILSGLNEDNLKTIIPPGSRCATPQPSTVIDPNLLVPSLEHKAVLLMDKLGMKRQDLLNLPSGIGLILGSAVQKVTESSVQGWPIGACRLISRLDMHPGCNNDSPTSRDSDEILCLRFNKDQRVVEVRRLLRSSEPVTISIIQRPEVSDHEFIEEQERHLYAICTRTMALPVGRGMMDLHSSVSVVITEQLNIPKLCLSGRAPPRGAAVELSHIEVVPNMNLWPLFHNGVASGLKISPLSKNIDSTWILYNKPKNGVDALPEHAGFLMGLGLSGHLSDLMHLYLYNYLNKCHEMTSVGLLLGLAASKRGTMDVRATKLFSLHIESLLPPTSIELDLVQNIQVAALLGIGLVYQGTGHRHIAEALLSEIGRPPGPEMENSCDRECYSLAAGLGLGLVILGKGADPTILADLDLADTLQYYMIGGHKRPLTGSQKEKYKSPSYQIREGDCVNNHVTGPGATLALGMMYFNTGNTAVAKWLEAPDSEYMLDFICPDQLLLRILARGLVLWEQIIPTQNWVESHVPATIRPYCLVKPREGLEDVDLETMSQAYCNIIAGACMALGLKFAGSANNQAFETLFHYCKLFTSLSSKSIAELAGKSTIETCICVTLLSLAVVMAGTGDLEVLRLCRHLGSRVGQVTNSVVTYGSHLAVHMALGLLFLGGGALALSTRPEAIAAMICAFFPRFPTHSNDNRYHLQAFRHLYVLAVEPRLFLPKDIDHDVLCFASLHVVYLDTPYYKNQSVTLFAPCLLPELHLLKEVRVEDERYWPIVFTKEKNWSQLEETLKEVGTVGIKLRAGCLPYVDDPHGYKTLLAQTLSTDTATSWTTSGECIQAFVLDKTCNFTKYFLETSETDVATANRELKLIQWLSSISYECVTRNKLPLLDYWINMLSEVMRLKGIPSALLAWQMRLVLAHSVRSNYSHLQPDHMMSVNQYIKSVFEKWQNEHLDILDDYIKLRRIEAKGYDLLMLTAYLTFFCVPNQSTLQKVMSQGPNKVLNLVCYSKGGGHIPPPVTKLLWKLYSQLSEKPKEGSRFKKKLLDSGPSESF